jgi:hypothetical protein
MMDSHVEITASLITQRNNGISDCGRAGELEWAHTTELLGVNEWQEGQWRSFEQVRMSMPADRADLRTMWLLPFAAAAVDSLRPLAIIDR